MVLPGFRRYVEACVQHTGKAPQNVWRGPWIWAVLFIAWWSVVSAVAQDPSLKLHLSFDQFAADGTVLDQSGNGSHGVQFNRTNLLGTTNGVFGTLAGHFQYVGFISNDPPHVYRFSQYLAVTNIGAFHYLTNGTISFWAQFGRNGDLGMRVLDTGYTPAYTPNPSLSSNSWTIARSIDPYLSFTVYQSSGARDVVRWPNDVVRSGGSSPDLSTTNYHLYTVTFDCSKGTAVSYYDGRPYQTNTLSVPWLRIYGGQTKRWLCIGAMAHAGSPEWGDDRYPNSGFFVGGLDELRIYNRALSPAEIATLYYGDAGGTTVFVSATDASAGEPGTGQGTGTFTFTRTGSLAGALTVNLNVGGTAVAGADYTAIPSTLTFVPGDATATIPVVVTDDPQNESLETLVVTVLPGTGYTVGNPAAATVTITDDDDTPPLTEFIVDNASSAVTYQGTWNLSTTTAGYWGADYRQDGNWSKGSKSAKFTPNLPSAGTYDVYIWYPARSDYANNVPVDIIHAGGTTTVPVDQTANGGRWNLVGTFNFNAGTGGYARIRNAGTTGFVMADAFKFTLGGIPLPRVTLAATDPVAGEPGAGAGGGTVEVYRTSPLEASLAVNIATSGTASAGTDYAAIPSTITFAPGANSVTIPVIVTDDAHSELQETIVVTVLPGTGYTVGDSASATVTISDDDAMPVTELIIDNASSAVTYQGTWNLSTTTAGYWAANYRQDGNWSKGSKSAKFTPNLPTAGSYQVYMWFPSRADYANNVPVDIIHAGGTTTVTVDQTANGGMWNLLGTFNFNSGTLGYARVRNAGTTGFVMADALKWVSTPAPSSAPQPLKALIPPAGKPLLVTIERDSAGSLSLGWPSVSGTGYRVERSSDGGKSWQSVFETVGDGSFQHWEVYPAESNAWFRLETF